MRKFSKLLAQALLMTLLVATAQAQTKSKTFKTEETTISVEVIASDLVHPWGMTMLPNNKILVTERGGTLKLVNYKTF